MSMSCMNRVITLVEGKREALVEGEARAGARGRAVSGQWMDTLHTQGQMTYRQRTRLMWGDWDEGDWHTGLVGPGQWHEWVNTSMLNALVLMVWVARVWLTVWPRYSANTR